MFGLDPAMVLGAQRVRHPRSGAPLGTLTRDDCLDLVAQHEVGRVAFALGDGPGPRVGLVPVNYVLRTEHSLGVETLEFRTTSSSELAVHAPGTEIAFEIDHIDPATRSGWSVVVRGECHRDLERFGETTRLGERSADPWASGRRPMVLTLAARTVTGKVVGLGEWDSLHV